MPAGKAVRRGGWMPVRFPVPRRARASLRSGAALAAGVGKADFYAVTGVSILSVIIESELPGGTSLLGFVSDGPMGEAGLLLLAVGLILYALWSRRTHFSPFEPGEGPRSGRS